MEIVKELNKDDGLEFIKNGSITHAVNVIVDNKQIYNIIRFIILLFFIVNDFRM